MINCSNNMMTQLFLSRFIHSFFLDIYIAPLQETYSEVLSVQLGPKRNDFRSL